MDQEGGSNPQLLMVLPPMPFDCNFDDGDRSVFLINLHNFWLCWMQYVFKNVSGDIAHFHGFLFLPLIWLMIKGHSKCPYVKTIVPRDMSCHFDQVSASSIGYQRVVFQIDLMLMPSYIRGEWYVLKFINHLKNKMYVMCFCWQLEGTAY